MKRTRLATLVVVATLVVNVVTPGASADGDLDTARRDAEWAATGFAEAEAALGVLAQERATLESTIEQAESDLADLTAQVQVLAIAQYVDGGANPASVLGVEPNDQVLATALARIVGQADADVLDEYRATDLRLADARVALEANLAAQEVATAELESYLGAIETEVARLEDLEAERKAAEEAAAAAAAVASNRTQVVPASGSSSNTGVPGAVASSGGSTAGSSLAVAVPGNGGMVCPVPGSTFIDSWGAPRSQGWSHKGVDMMASSGTPILSPVSGFVTHRGNNVGGLAFHIDGDDGRYYYGAHLSAYGASGQVPAGTVIGYVGNTGDAAYTPAHLHLEIHIGGMANNPTPFVAAVC